MFNIILIDDDIVSLKTLSKIFPWEMLGFKLMGVFHNASEALDFVEHNKVDVILSDVAMPDIDGVDLARICSKDHPKIKIVLISAYRDFEAARTVIGLKNVVEYLTKPIDCSKLEATLSSIRDSLNFNKYDSFQSEDDYSYRLAFFSNLVCGHIKDTASLISGLESMNLDISNCDRMCTLINFHISNFTEYSKNTWKHSNNQLYYAISNIFPFENDYGYYSMANYSYGNFSWVIIHKSSQDAQQVIQRFSETLTFYLKEILKIDAEKSSYKVWSKLSDLVNQTSLNYFEDAEHDVISRALAYMHDNYNKNISLNDVAEHVYMTPVYFSTFFKKITGENFIKRITAIRLEHAKDLLLNSDMTVNEICFKVGYNHIGNFLDKFKKYFKMTPNEYRKLYIKKDD